MMILPDIGAPTQSLSSLSQSSLAVGSSWMLSSMILTTYYSTAFLRYKEEPITHDFEKRKAWASIRREKPISLDSEVPRKEKKNLDILLSKYYTRPQLLTILRLSGSFLLGIFVHPNFFNYNERLTQVINVMKDFILPAFFMFLANYCNVIALDRLGISLLYTSKCGIPILTVLITVLVDGIDAIPPISTLCTLIPIAIGIAMASWNSPKFDETGFLAAIISATSQASLNVSCKRALTNTKIGGLQAQTTMAALAFIFAMITTTFENVQKSLFTQSSEIKSVEAEKVKTVRKTASNVDNHQTTQKSPPLLLALGAVTAYHIEYVLSFLFLSLVKPITYGTCDAIRRLGIIICGRRMFGGEAFSMFNYSGIGLAVIGALSYSISTSLSP